MVAHGRIRRQHPGTGRAEAHHVREPIRPRRAQRQDVVSRDAECGGPREPRALGGTHHEVIVAMQEAALRVGRRGQRVETESFQRSHGMPDLHHGRSRAMWCDVDRQVRVVDDEQPRCAQVVHAPDQPEQVAQLAGQAIGIRLQQQDDRATRVAGHDRRVQRREIAVKRRDARGGEDDPLAVDGQEPEYDADEPGATCSRTGTRRGPRGAQACWRTMMFWPSSVRSSSRMSVAMTSATALGCMILDGSSSGARMRRSSVAVRPGEML